MNKFLEIAGRIGSQRHLVAIRDGFVIIMPLMILGSMITLINNLPIDAYQNFMNSIFNGDTWKQFGGSVWTGTFAIVSLLVSFTIAYQLAKSYDKDGLSAGIVSFAASITIMQPVAEGSGLPMIWAGAQGLFIAIISSLIATELFIRLLGNKKLVMKMPPSVPPAVARSFAALFPAMITLSLFGLIKVLMLVGGIPDIHQAFYDLIQSPVSKMANTLWSAVIIALLIHVLWFFGLHGSNIMEPVMQTVYLPAIEANAKALEAGQEIPYIVTKPFFDAFMYLGGTGATLALIIAVFIAGRRHKHYRNISGLGAAPSLFNINEPILFGFPIVLNPLLIIPFIITPVVLTVFSYLVIAAGIVPKTIAFIPWTTPPIIGGFLATGSLKGAALAFVNLVIAVVIYLPFIKVAERNEVKKLEELAKAEQTTQQ
ncbi:PTS sugar transporter subunit IIC [Ferdinandcohnia quinoae]|uniref:Permease IIC component n=1 Tax=Fredinandcohnia quinoae TaxID=2918902 RepID=A0AAW5E1K4_9BACI|nr:PTS sugar transporter subunit IIC [Fredinandcohnia sp. SECRCQ15]MCH1626498.1 PTS sugar transporter subunit IIC [Fredinandcohnia sp. SECRCQ15]